MHDKNGGFPNEKTRARYLAVYDELLDWPVPHTELTVETPFGPTHVRRSGDGPPLVLLHGVSATSIMWQSVVAGLAARHTVYAVDTIGEAGRSVQTAPLPDAASHAEWLEAVLARLDLGAAHLVGLSRGGWLALNQAVHAPARVAAVTAFDPGGFAPVGWRMHRWMIAGLLLMLAPAAVRARFADSPRYGAFVNPTVRRLVLAQLPFRPNGFGMGTFTDAELAAITTPTTVVLGGQSPVHDAAEVAARVRAVNLAVRVEVLPAVGHGSELLDADLLGRYV
ncbi:alpha/beta fold hydrolase [Actinophytocola glycyrrhizae]|uniref:Alpha/beta fold hydrolase n=1 Tax=Actinophytocola glycyrrhizae TaxID=2044873 RepID=A0ABV9RSF2_9PSEU